MHHLRHRARLKRGQQQMHMVAHQYIGVKLAAEAQQRLSQALQIALAILIVQKAWQTIVAPLHHVLRNTGKLEAWKSGHAGQHRPLPYAPRSAQTAPPPHPGRQPPVRNCPRHLFSSCYLDGYVKAFLLGIDADHHDPSAISPSSRNANHSY
jgi:hypothetical protein